MSLYLGVDMGGSSVKTALLDGSDVVATHRTLLDGADALQQLSVIVEETVAREQPAAVGIGLAGLVRWPDGEFVWGPHLSVAATAVRSRLTRVAGVPVVVDNDANTAAYGELVGGKASGVRHGLVLTIGTGIGGGLIAEGEVYRGSSFAGEVGHVAVEPDGLPCPCGRRGCWETRISGRVLDEAARRLTRDPAASAADLMQAASNGDHAAAEAVWEAGTWLGAGIANLVAVLDPERVVVAGAVSAAGEVLLRPARSAIASRLSGASERRRVELVASERGGYAGAIGAAYLARDEAASG